MVLRPGCICCFVFLPVGGWPAVAMSALWFALDICGVEIICLQSVSLEHWTWLEMMMQIGFMRYRNFGSL